MKTYSLFTFLGFSIMVLASCSHDVSMETIVHADGKIDKTVAFEGKDSTQNMMGVSEKSGWKKTVKKNQASSDSIKDQDVTTIYQKTFSSVDEVNAELATPNDTLFRVTSTFEKKFSGFYTYLYYADTYHTLNRMDLSIDNYVTPEDYTFIERLPAEGKKISRADSLYLVDLNKKLFDGYGTRAIYEAYFDLNLAILDENRVEKSWIDSLKKNKENFYQLLITKKDIENDFLLNAMDSIGIPLPYEKLKREYPARTKLLDRKVNFITTANDGKYIHKIEMPWDVVRTNADSVAGTQLFWSPPSTKFLVKDYTMYAEARRLNYWTVGLLAVLVGFTGYIFIRRKNK